MKPILFWSGATAVAAGVGIPLLLPSAPASIQSNPVLQPIGSFIINNQNWIALLGLIVMLVGLFL